MQTLINKKKIFFYFFVFFILNSINFNNKNTKITQKIEYEIYGLKNHNSQKLLNELNSLNYENIFFSEKNEIRNLILSNPEIESFKVKKLYPNKILIQLTKTNLITEFKLNNKNFFLGENGKKISFYKTDASLPIAHNVSNEKELYKFVLMLKKSELDFKKISEIYYFPSMRWDIKYDKNTIIKLPRKNLAQNLKIASKILKQSNAYLIKVIDLRVKNQVIIENEQK